GSHGRFAGSGALGELADADRERRAEQHALLRSEESGRVATDLLEAPRRGELGELADAKHAERRSLNIDRENGRDGTHDRREEAHGEPGACREVRTMGRADGARSQGLDQRGHGAGERAVGPTGVVCGLPGFWSRAEWYVCRDGKARPVEPGIFPLADGVSGRVAVVRPGVKAETAIQDEIRWVSRAGALRGAGNAIVPQVAAEVIRAYM